MKFLRKSYKVVEGGAFLDFLDKSHFMIILLLKYNLSTFVFLLGQKLKKKTLKTGPLHY